MQIIPQPLPRIHLIRIQPRFPIRQRQEKPPSTNHKRQHNTARSPQRQHGLTRDPIFRRNHDPLAASIFVLARGLGLGLLEDVFVETDGVEVEDEFEEGAGDEGGGEVSGEVVVEEELAAHEVEGEVVGGPAEEEEAGAVVETGTSA